MFEAVKVPIICLYGIPWEHGGNDAEPKKGLSSKGPVYDSPLDK